jgi:hypothetical protein
MARIWENAGFKHVARLGTQQHRLLTILAQDRGWVEGPQMYWGGHSEACAVATHRALRSLHRRGLIEIASGNPLAARITSHGYAALQSLMFRPLSRSARRALFGD